MNVNEPPVKYSAVFITADGLRSEVQKVSSYRGDPIPWYRRAVMRDFPIINKKTNMVEIETRQYSLIYINHGVLVYREYFI